MSSKEINLNDIADDLLIVDRRTVDHLFSLENPADCVALYMFFYKTAKWQGTKSIKANDLYIRKCLNWGAKRVTTTKSILESAGLIKQIARRKDGKITGHFIEVAYLLHHNTRKPLVDETMCGFGETNAYKDNIKCLDNTNTLMDTKVSIGSEAEVVSYGKAEINQLFETWEATTGLPITSNKTKNRYACNNLVTKYGVEGVEKLIRVVERAQSDRYAPRVADFCDLQAKLNQLLVWAKNQTVNTQVISVEDF